VLGVRRVVPADTSNEEARRGNAVLLGPAGLDERAISKRLRRPVSNPFGVPGKPHPSPVGERERIGGDEVHVFADLVPGLRHPQIR
jgi:hypothetical protein